MAKLTRYQKIQEAIAEVRSLQQQYLQTHGWTYTCNIPGAYWLWRRDFAVEDAARHARWKERGPGPLGMPSEPRPYGVITADEDLAVSITRKELDDEVDQDGDPDTPVMTAEDWAKE